MNTLKMVIVILCLGIAIYGDSQKIQGHNYKILDTTGFYLYSLNKLVQGEKIARPQTVYYFSVKADDTIRELTLDNLEKAFAANTRFRYQLEAQFRRDQDLIAYDNILKTYKIKYLYQQTIPL